MYECTKEDVLWVREELKEHDRFFEKLQKKIPRNSDAGEFIFNTLSEYITREGKPQLMSDTYLVSKIKDEYASPSNYVDELNFRQDSARTMIINVYLCYINHENVCAMGELFTDDYPFSNRVKISYRNITELNVILGNCELGKVSRYFDPNNLSKTQKLGIQLCDIARVDNVARRHKRFFKNIVTSLLGETVNNQSTARSRVCRVICEEINDYVYEINDLATSDIDRFIQWLDKNNLHGDVNSYIYRLNADMFFAKNFIINVFVYDFPEFPEKLSVKDNNYEAYFGFGYADFIADLYDTREDEIEVINSILEQAGFNKLERK